MFFKAGNCLFVFVLFVNTNFVFSARVGWESCKFKVKESPILKEHVYVAIRYSQKGKEKINLDQGLNNPFTRLRMPKQILSQSHSCVHGNYTRYFSDHLD